MLPREAAGIRESKVAVSLQSLASEGLVGVERGHVGLTRKATERPYLKPPTSRRSLQHIDTLLATDKACPRNDNPSITIAVHIDRNSVLVAPCCWTWRT